MEIVTVLQLADCREGFPKQLKYEMAFSEAEFLAHKMSRSCMLERLDRDMPKLLAMAVSTLFCASFSEMPMCPILTYQDSCKA